MTGVLSRLATLLARDLRLVLRGGTDAGVALAFFAVAITLFPLGVGPEPQILARIAAGVLWVAALLASLLSMERLFAQDHEDGTLDVLATSGPDLALVAFAKMAAHWLVTGLPLIVLAPIAASMLALPAAGYTPLIAGLVLGTPCLSLIGGIGAALVLGTRRGGALLALLVLPLMVPILVFAVGAVDAAVNGFSPGQGLLLLGAILALALPLAPIAAGAALRQAVG
jgi:heme exporter protein B